MAKLIKISDNKFHGNHPNGINANSVVEGIVLSKPEVGKSCIVTSATSARITSIITSIEYETENEIRFNTANSTYQLFFREDEIRDGKVTIVGETQIIVIEENNGQV